MTIKDSYSGIGFLNDKNFSNDFLFDTYKNIPDYIELTHNNNIDGNTPNTKTIIEISNLVEKKSLLKEENIFKIVY